MSEPTPTQIKTFEFLKAMIENEIAYVGSLSKPQVLPPRLYCITERLDGKPVDASHVLKTKGI